MPSANAEGARTKIDLLSDRSPAGGTIAAFEFAERRQVPLAALQHQPTPIPWGARSGLQCLLLPLTGAPVGDSRSSFSGVKRTSRTDRVVPAYISVRFRG